MSRSPRGVRFDTNGNVAGERKRGFDSPIVGGGTYVKDGIVLQTKELDTSKLPTKTSIWKYVSKPFLLIQHIFITSRNTANVKMLER